MREKDTIQEFRQQSQYKAEQEMIRYSAGVRDWLKRKYPHIIPDNGLFTTLKKFFKYREKVNEYDEILRKNKI